jgi:DNA-directed RNA polymerase specialized sigma24 family protein
VLKQWDRLDKNRIARENYYEQLISSDMFDWSIFDEESKMRDENDFFPLMFSCICKMHEMIEDADISRLLNKATEKQKRVFFPRVVKGCSTTKIAHCHGITDRNVRKLLDVMLDKLRRNLYEALKKRHETEPRKATLREKKFLESYNYVPKVKKTKKR